MRFLFGDYALDLERRELRRGAELVEVEPQVFDLQGWRARGNPAEIEGRKALLRLVRVGWGQDNPAFRQVFTSLMIPGGTLEQAQWVNDLQRVSTSPENAARLLQVFGDIDVTQLLPRVAAPTLVLHSRGDAPCPFEQGLSSRAESPMPGSLRSKAATTSSCRTNRHGSASWTRYAPFWMRMAVQNPPPRTATALRQCDIPLNTIVCRSRRLIRL